MRRQQAGVGDDRGHRAVVEGARERDRVGAIRRICRVAGRTRDSDIALADVLERFQRGLDALRRRTGIVGRRLVAIVGEAVGRSREHHALLTMPRTAVHVVGDAGAADCGPVQLNRAGSGEGCTHLCRRDGLTRALDRRHLVVVRARFQGAAGRACAHAEAGRLRRVIAGSPTGRDRATCRCDAVERDRRRGLFIECQLIGAADDIPDRQRLGQVGRRIGRRDRDVGRRKLQHLDEGVVELLN